jgi:hypothetical protein
MGLGNVFVIVILVYYTNYIVGVLISKRQRSDIKEVNTKLNDLRKVAVKTLEQQKEFINARYPKNKWTFSYKMIPKFLFTIMYIGIFYAIFYYIFSYLHIDLVFWQGFALMITLPIVFNFILGYAKLQKSDVTVFLKGWFR